MEKKVEDTLFDWSIPVDNWPEEQLELWARNNITKDTVPQPDWHERQFAIWKAFKKSAKIPIAVGLSGLTENKEELIQGPATSPTKPIEEWTEEDVLNYVQKECKFDQEDLAILKRVKVDGETLLLIEDKKRLQEYGLAAGRADKLWSRIEKLKNPSAEPDRKRKREDDGTDFEPRKKSKSLSELEHIISSTINLPEPVIDSYVTRNLPWTSRIVASQDVINRVLDALHEVNSNWKSTDTRSIPLFTLTGASGIGKTRFGVELLSLLQQSTTDGGELSEALKCSRLIFLNFANGDKSIVKSKFTKKDIYGQLAFRILYPNEAFDENDFDSTAISRAALIELINKLRPHPSTKLVLHIQIDEFQKGLLEEDFEKIETAQKDIGLKAYLSMLLSIAVGLKKFNVLTILTCTGVLDTKYSGVFPATDYNIISLPLCLLSKTQATSLAQKQLGNDVYKVPFIKTLVRAMGGLPKAIHFLVSVILSFDVKDLNASISIIWKKTCDLVSQFYRAPRNSETLFEVLTAAILGIEVDRNSKIGYEYVYQLEEEGYLYIDEQLITGKYKISVPYVLLSIWRSDYMPFRFGNLFSTEQFPPILLSADFEQFVLYFQTWKYAQIGSSGIEMRLKDLHSNACTSATVAKIRVGATTEMPSLYYSKSEDITDNDFNAGKISITNGSVDLAKTPLALWIGRSCVGLDALLMYNKSATEDMPVAILIETKHTIPAQQEKTATLQKKELEKEKDDFAARKAQFLKYGIHAISVLITNKKVDSRDERKAFFDIYVDRENFVSYFGTVFQFLRDTDLT